MMALSRVGLLDVIESSLELSTRIVAQGLLAGDGGEQRSVFATQRRQHRLLEVADLADRNAVEIAIGAGKDHRNLLFHLERGELGLLEQLGQTGTTVQQALGGGVEVR